VLRSKLCANSSATTRKPARIPERVFRLDRRRQFSRGFDLQMDQLTVVMVLVVTGVGFLIHVYSTG